MKSMRRRRPSPALIVAIIALIVALSGTAIAANMITSDDIVDGQVMTRDLHAGAVTPAKISRIPAVGLVRNTNMAVNPNTPVLVSFDAENYDTADMHGSGFLVKAPITGIYQVTAHVSWKGTLSSTLPDGTECSVGIARGTPVDQQGEIGTSNGECSHGHSIELNRTVKLSRNETLFMGITQDSDNPFTLDASATPAYLDVTWVAPPS